MSEIRRVRAALTAEERRIRRDFLAYLSEGGSGLTLAEWIDALFAGDIERILDAYATPGRNFARSAAQGQTRIADATVTASRLSMVFDTTNPRVVRNIQDDARRIERVLEADRRVSLTGIARAAGRPGVSRADLARALREEFGLTGNQTGAARDARMVAGLTPRQNDTVLRFRRMLERGDREALRRLRRDRRFDRTLDRTLGVNADRALTPVQIDRMVSRYRERLLRLRVDTIATTEATRSLGQGQLHAARQMDAESVSTVWLRWRTARDESVRASHSSMDGQRRRPGEAFRSGNGRALMHPGDRAAPASETVNCRCVLVTEFGD